MSKIDDLKLRDVEISSNSQTRSSSYGSSGYNGPDDPPYGSGGSYGSRGRYGSSDFYMPSDYFGSSYYFGSKGYGSNGHVDFENSGLGTSRDDCMTQEVFSYLCENGILKDSLYVCGLGYTVPETVIHGGSGIGDHSLFVCKRCGAKYNAELGSCPLCGNGEGNPKFKEDLLGPCEGKHLGDPCNIIQADGGTMSGHCSSLMTSKLFCKEGIWTIS